MRDGTTPGEASGILKSNSPLAEGRENHATYNANLKSLMRRLWQNQGKRLKKRKETWELPGGLAGKGSRIVTAWCRFIPWPRISTYCGHGQKSKTKIYIHIHPGMCIKWTYLQGYKTLPFLEWASIWCGRHFLLRCLNFSVLLFTFVGFEMFSTLVDYDFN